MASFDLQAYLNRFPEVCRKKFGRVYNFHALEKDFEQLRTGKRWLVARDVLKLFDPARTPFAQYWAKPAERELDQVLKKERQYLAPIASDRGVVRSLLGVLHHTGVVSLVLRFVHPGYFGTFSTPAINLLLMHRPTTVELYLAFCEELREWQKHFRLVSVADTELGLWTFHTLTSGPEPSAEAEQARAEFDADVWIQRRRAAQVLRPFFKKYGALELARIFVEEHPKLAGKFAGEEYERRLRSVARRVGLRLGVKGAVEVLLDRLAQYDYITLEQKTRLRKVWEIRNRAVHPAADLTLEEVENMIETIEDICLGWESKPLEGPGPEKW